MILEIAQIDVVPGQQPCFEMAAARGLRIVASAPGCRGAELHGSVETAGRYRLIVAWDSVADHVDGFQRSAAFEQWRMLVSRYFVALPQVEHLRLVAAEPDRITRAAGSPPRAGAAEGSR